MPGCDHQKNPLERSGVSQGQRQLPGLTPDYARLDERRYSDWIVFAVEFSRRLKFYDSSTGLSTGDWQPFFARDISAHLGRFAVQDIEAYRLAIKKRMDFLRDNHNAADEPGLKKNLSELFSAVLTLSKSLDEFFLLLTNDTSFKRTLQQLVQGKLGPAFRRLLSYYKAASTAPLNYYTTVNDPSWKILGRSLEDAAAVLSDPAAFSADWWEAPPGITSLATVLADSSVFGNGATVFAKINHASNHFLFTSIFDQFTESYTRLIGEAEASLLATLENWNGHNPQYALFLAFLRLFRTTQTRMNGLTWRHLDYYYRVVLKLKPREAIPNHVILIAELAKAVTKAALPAGTLFKAGKDSNGAAVVYALDKETTFNKAEVAAFRALYRGDSTLKDNWTDPLNNLVDNRNRLFAAPVMNSEDGLGAELRSPVKEWHPFANKSRGTDGKIFSINMPPAQIGFAIASHYLLLAEGRRVIRLRFDGHHAAAFKAAKLICYLTCEKKWLEKTPLDIADTQFTGGGNCTEVVIEVVGAEPAITPFNLKIHGGAFNVDVPVVKCVLQNELGATLYGYDALGDITLTQMEIRVEVGSSGSGVTSYKEDGAKQLVLANLNGTIDSSKPFQPWGASPTKDSPLVIGNKELFSKKNAFFNLHIAWADRPSTITTASPNARLQVLKGGVWQNLSATVTSNHVSSGVTQKTFAADAGLFTDADIDYRDAYALYNPASQAGFFRLLLDGDFGQEAYLADYTIYLLQKAAAAAKGELPKGAADGKDSGTPKAPTKPYLPVVSAMYLNYAAYTGKLDLLKGQQETFENRPARFFHLGPGGEAEQHGRLTGATTLSLVPQFRSAKNKNNAGEWYIGIKNLAARQSIQILFQLLEGSTDPLVSKPIKHVEWSYLSQGQWKGFEERQISDSTMQLVQSGIIGFTIPDDATTNDTLFPQGYTWLRASVTEAVDAVCKILSVQAQALLATLQPHGNAADFLDKPLPAGTITKLKEPDTAFKKFSQPYASFGGRQKEAPAQFYLRSSERLRHKGRAVTIWDYEHLVLDAFPQLYKAKCLNHTIIKDNPDSSKAIHNENQPGHVALITIPTLVNRNEINPLKPYTSQGLLSEIQEFLIARTTGQLLPSPTTVNVHVCNPLFEEISLEFYLSLHAGYTDFTYYSELLAQEVTHFLSPWAYDAAAEVQFGGRISKSVLIDFIEERPYVDFITDVLMRHKPENKPLSGDVEEAVATTSRSILVSAVNSDHNIVPHSLKPLKP